MVLASPIRAEIFPLGSVEREAFSVGRIQDHLGAGEDEAGEACENK
eukprot:CAMPEP_0172598660 /NCGR_PEP_ID=MMETSP1068-20121228/18715_1 /TAXON_ID=35684 /ORGANISM="Pseudopedinella elastica, Strain CCMP716" /LENGTH=45 /DNA_ID= /DNA_START= /DNA_END= /DNA_ORIENTATION=